MLLIDGAFLDSGNDFYDTLLIENELEASRSLSCFVRPCAKREKTRRHTHKSTRTYYKSPRAAKQNALAFELRNSLKILLLNVVLFFFSPAGATSATSQVASYSSHKEHQVCQRSKNNDECFPATTTTAKHPELSVSNNSSTERTLPFYN